MSYLSPKRVVVLLIFSVNLLISSALFAIPTLTPQHGVFNRDGSQLIFVSASGNEIVKQQARTGRVIKRIPFKLTAGSTLLAPTPDGFKLLSVHAKGIDVIHNGTGKILRTLPYPSGRYDWKDQPIKQNTDGSLLALPSLRNALPKIYLIHTGSGKIIRTINLTPKGRRWKPHTRLGSIAFSANKRLLAYTLYPNKKGTLYLYEINTQQALMSIDIGITQSIDKEMLHFSPNNQTLVISGIKKKNITLVDIKQKKVSTLPYPKPHFVNFTADNQHLLIIQPHQQRITFRHLITGKQTHHKLALKTSADATAVIQSYHKTWLALPLRSAPLKETALFLLINGRTGTVVR